MRKSPQRAVLYVTSQGIVEPRLNGAKVGDDFLVPGWTDYHKRIYYRAYDVTPQVRQGDNTLGAILGDGWFRGHLSIIGQNLYGRQTRLLAQLHVFYADGSSDGRRQRRFLDGRFRADPRRRSVRRRNLRCQAGTRRLGPPGLCQSRLAAGAGRHASEPDHPSRAGSAVQRTGEIRPVAITQPKPGLHVVDFGRNFAGWMRLRIHAPAGTKITMRFGEMLNADGTVYRTNLRGARATDCYICKGTGEEVWEPRFTYHGFQYVEVEGLARPPDAKTFTGVLVGSALPLTGSFACSNEIMTRTADNMRCTIRANLVDVPTDCPQRDERMGWMDYHEVAASTLYEQDAASLLTKWMADIVDARLDDGGFSMIAPDVHRFGWSPGWADSSVLIPWTMYNVYGDTRLCRAILSRAWPATSTIINSTPPALVGPGRGAGRLAGAGHVDPQGLISTALFAACARNMSVMAAGPGQSG